MVKRAIFLGCEKFKSKSGKDCRKVDLYVPFYVQNGFTRGGVISVWTDPESKLGDDIKCGSVVIPSYDYDGVSRRADLSDIKVVKATPYTDKDFE